MIDLHTHSFFSDGALVPSELVRRAEALGLKGIGITDHGDSSNIDFIVPRIVAVAADLNECCNIRVIPGIELTHVPPRLIADMAKKARDLGAKLIAVHGETVVEPVSPGTNRAALEADVDILAHPGLITEAEVIRAKERGIYLEISARKGHCLTNGHLAKLAQKIGAKLVIDTDTHDPGDLIDDRQARRVVLGAGLTDKDFDMMQENAAVFL